MPADYRRRSRGRRSRSRGKKDRHHSRRREKEKEVIKSTLLYISNLSRNVNDDHLKNIFGSYGKIQNAAISVDKTVGLPKGYAYVEFEHLKDADKAAECMHQGQIDGSTISVTFFKKPEKEKSPARKVKKGKTSAPKKKAREVKTSSRKKDRTSRRRATKRKSRRSRSRSSSSSSSSSSFSSSSSR
eukprot:GEMP01060550.1.p1 GENE.GEMP01060550.1~~GEMP01060550.1.p1  ORF type:complete len:186 (+),score=45.10 GEMP01060550.1:72-629(+)